MFTLRLIWAYLRHPNKGIKKQITFFKGFSEEKVALFLYTRNYNEYTK